MTSAHRGAAALVFSLALSALSAEARAQLGAPGAPPAPEGITVSGKGVVSARPNRLEIEMEVSASSEISSDVIVKYRDAKKRLQDAFAGLKMKDVKIEERALSVDQKGQVYNPYYMDAPPARKGKIEVQLKRKLVVSCTGIRDMDEEALLQLVAKLLDVAQDSGGKLGGQNEYNPYYGRFNQAGGMVKFVLDDFDDPQTKAYQAAIDDARGRATRLAALSGRNLGAVTGVREVLVPGEKPQSTSVTIYDYGINNQEEEPSRKRLESSRFQEIPVRVELQVRFDFAKAP